MRLIRYQMTNVNQIHHTAHRARLVTHNENPTVVLNSEISIQQNNVCVLVVISTLNPSSVYFISWTFNGATMYTCSASHNVKTLTMSNSKIDIQILFLKEVYVKIMYIVHLMNLINAVITTKLDLFLSRHFGHQSMQLTFRKWSKNS